MPIVTARTTGAVVSAPAYSQAALDAAWARIVRKYLELHPELLREDLSQDGCGTYSGGEECSTE